jgi:transcription initiation factor TFIIIB Brf1 subunit/transcription initiation factor TFIIB
MVQIKQRPNFKPAECNHHNTIFRNGFKVCTNCGNIIDKHFISGRYLRGDTRDIQKHGTPPRATALGDTQSTFREGTTFRKKDIYNTHNSSLFFRLKRIDKYRYKDQETYLRIFKRLHKVCLRLGIPRHITEAAAYRFRKLKNGEYDIINNSTAIVYCLWDTIRFYRFNTNLKDLINAFKEEGTHIRGRLLIRDGALYSEYLKSEGIVKSKPKHASDYIPTLIANLLAHRDRIQERLTYKNVGISPENYIFTLERFAFYIIDIINIPLKYSGINPFQTASTVLYVAGKMVGKIKGYSSTVLTQSLIAEITNVATYSVRGIYGKLLKPILDVILLKLKEGGYDTE